jgi:predicted N-acetyltransferase YhbS
VSQSHLQQNAAPSFKLLAESTSDIRQRNLLLDQAMSPNWRKKASNALRRGYVPSEGLAFVAKNQNGQLIGTVRLWDVITSQSGTRALMLGPLAVAPDLKGAGIGSALMHLAIAKAEALNHGAIILMGDPDYYARFGFTAEKTGNLQMPGPFEPHRFLALELRAGALDQASGVLLANGRRKELQKSKSKVA